ncbi:MAG: RNA polymerase factor sigma-54 [Deltaproteobacteria bacterium]|nr:RNA polymerase factor sigma-54 [Deltaproteobacteria bacterium]
MGLELKLGLNLKLQQQLVMTPQLQQAIRLLQLSRLELIDAVHAELEQNPTLEEADRPEREVIEAEAAITGEDTKPPAPEPERPQEVGADAEKTVGEIDWDQWLDSYNSAPPMPSGLKRESSEDLPTLEQTLTKPETLSEHLVWQLDVSNFCAEDKRVAYEVIGALDDRGFLPGDRPLEEIAIRLEVSVDHVERVLGLIQGFDPVGIAARTLEECLLIQLKAYGNKNVLADRLVREFLPDLEKRNFQAIAKKAEVPMDEVAEALRIIQNLDPRPARSFGGEDSIYITPDLYVHKVGSEYVIVPNEDGMPMLRLSKYYKSALANGMNGEAKAYVQEKLRSAQWLIRSIHQRQRTIYKVMESILKFQRDFFDKGIEHLRPLILRDVAEDIGMHESTISRVTSNKYVHTPRGIFELKYFFNSSVSGADGEDVASVSVKHRIKQIVESEDAKRPHSDQAIVEILGKEGIDIARRTVAKYRESMGILSSSKRREII